MWCHYLPIMEHTPVKEYDQEMILYALERDCFTDIIPMLNVIYENPYGEFTENCLDVIPRVHAMGLELYVYMHILKARGELPAHEIIHVNHTVEEFQGA